VFGGRSAFSALHLKNPRATEFFGTRANIQGGREGEKG